MPGYTACTACPDQSQFPTCQAVRQLPNLHLKPHQTLEAEHLQLAARHARLGSLHSLSSPRSPDQSQFPTCQAVRQLPNLHLKPHQTLEAEHLQLAARHARLYSLHSLSSPRSPDRSQFPTCQAVHQLPNLHLKTDQSLEAEHLQLAARHARLYSLRSLSSLRSPGQSPVPHISTSSPPTSSQARQAIQPAQPVQPTQPRPVTVPDMSAVHQLQTCTSNLTTEISQLAATYEA